MDLCQDDSICVKKTLEKILWAQKNAKKGGCEPSSVSCNNSIKELLKPNGYSSKNTIPFILYCNGCEPFKIEGVTTHFDPYSNKEKFICFSTFIFRIKDLKDNCAVLQLLKIKFDPCRDKDLCSPCDQLDCADVDDLIPTDVCINVDLACFCAIQCLPPVCL
jgi:hypothetical protein